MRKKSLLAMLLAMTLLLSSCALIVKDQAVDDATEIIRLGDKVINKAKVKEEIQNQLEYMEYYYSMMGQGYDVTDAKNIAQAQEDAINDLKKDLVLTSKAEELGLDKLTAEEEEEVKKTAQESYDYALDYAKTNMIDSSLNLEGEELEKAAVEALNAREVTLDAYIESETKTKVDNKLREYIVKDVAVTDEEIQAEYDSKVESDKETYGEKPGSYATAVNNGTTVYYAPAGVRRVKQILTKFKEEDQTAIDEAKQKVTDANTAITTANAKIDTAKEILGLSDDEGDEETGEAVAEETAKETEELSEEERASAQADLDAATKELEEAQAALEAANKEVEDATNKAFENIDADTDAILAELEGGADWDKLMEEKNQDPGMSTNEKGYAIAADMTGFDSAFVEAAMALAKPGDYSGKVKGTSYGYYIIRYENDEPEGPVALDEVKESISSSLLSTKKNEFYNTTVNEWVEAAGIKVDLNALKD